MANELIASTGLCVPSSGTAKNPTVNGFVYWREVFSVRRVCPEANLTEKTRSAVQGSFDLTVFTSTAVPPRSRGSEPRADMRGVGTGQSVRDEEFRMAKARQAAERRASSLTQPPLSRVLGQVERHVARLVEKALADHGMTLDQWRVLDVLADGEGHPMTEIAAAVVVPGPTLTKIADNLVDRALVYRLVDERDRRRVLAFLSDKGREVHATVEPKVRATEADALSGLDDRGPVLLELLARLATSVSTATARH